MKANELMIGDWVKIKTYSVSDKYERTEAYIYVKVAEISSGLITVEYNNNIKEPYRICENTEIEPIPLTPKILEKNEIDTVFKTRYKGFYLEYHAEAGMIVLYVYNNGSFQPTGICFKYVHELQHTLRLCRINCEIIL